MANAALKVGRTPNGYCVRVEGRGTMRESRAVHEFASQSVGGERGETLTVDLADCDYLDSTFLGCLVELHRKLGAARPPRFAVVTSPERAKRLFGPMCLDQVLNISQQPPDWVGEPVTVSPDQMDQEPADRKSTRL